LQISIIVLFGLMNAMKYLEATALKKNTKTGIACSRKGIYLD